MPGGASEARRREGAGNRAGSSPGASGLGSEVAGGPAAGPLGANGAGADGGRAGARTSGRVRRPAPGGGGSSLARLSGRR